MEVWGPASGSQDVLGRRSGSGVRPRPPPVPSESQPNSSCLQPRRLSPARLRPARVPDASVRGAMNLGQGTALSCDPGWRGVCARGWEQTPEPALASAPFSPRRGPCGFSTGGCGQRHARSRESSAPRGPARASVHVPAGWHPRPGTRPSAPGTPSPRAPQSLPAKVGVLRDAPLSGKLTPRFLGFWATALVSLPP